MLGRGAGLGKQGHVVMRPAFTPLLRFQGESQ